MTSRKLQPPPGKPEPEIFEPGAPLTEASMLHTLQQIRANAAREHERLRLAAIELDKNFERKAEARQRSYEKDTEEAQRLRQALERSRNKQLKYIVGLLIQCGCRVSELLHAEWSHFDLDRRLWRVPHILLHSCEEVRGQALWRSKQARVIVSMHDSGWTDWTDWKLNRAGQL